MALRESVDPERLILDARVAAQEFFLACKSDDEEWVARAFAAVPATVLAGALVALLEQARDQVEAHRDALYRMRDIEPRGVSKGRAWEIALASVGWSEGAE